MILGKFQDGSLEAAIFAANFFHAGQLDKSGEPYILHPLRVMQAVRVLGTEAMIKAVLHDCVEDTDMTLEDVRRGWGPEIHAGVDGLSHRKGKDGSPKETYFEYIRRLRDTPDPHVIRIKFADFDDNSDPTRAFDGELPSSADPSQSHSWLSLVKRYEKAKRILSGLDQ